MLISATITLHIIRQLLYAGFLTAVFTGPALPRSGNDHLKIAYNVLADSVKDNYEIFVMDADWSDMDEKEYDIYLMNADGSGVRKFPSLHRIEQAPVFVRGAGSGRK